MLMQGYTIKFVPVTYEARIGKSHVRYYRDTMRSLQIITHAILKYNPIKAFLTLSFIPLAGMGLSSILSLAALCLRQPVFGIWLGLVAVICLMTALIIFALGLVATTFFAARPVQGLPDRRN